MAELKTTSNYAAPPQHYQDAYSDGGSSDFIPLQGSQSVIVFGGRPVVGIDNISIQESLSKTPIYTLGMLESLGNEQGNLTVNVSGTITQNARMALQNSEFYPNTAADMMKYLNSYFDIEIKFQDQQADKNDRITSSVWTIKNCQRTGSNISIPNGKIIDSFTVLAQRLNRDFSSLSNFYPKGTTT